MSNFRGKVHWTPDKVEAVRHLYWDELLPPSIIVERLNLPVKPCRISCMLKRHGHPVRTYSEAIKITKALYPFISNREAKAYKWTPEILDRAKDLYFVELKGMKEISGILGINSTTITAKLKRSGVCLRSRSESQKLCHISHAESYCRENAPTWRGGRKITSSGYVSLLLEKSDPYYAMAQKSGYVPEHRYIMARYLGRCLKSWEVVHHRNSNRVDNRIENLKLLPSSNEHAAYTLSGVKMDKRICELEKRVTLLEAENTLLKNWLEIRSATCGLNLKQRGVHSQVSL